MDEKKDEKKFDYQTFPEASREYGDDEDLKVDYSIKGDYKHPILVMEGVRIVRDKRAKEMNQGYYNFKMDRTGNAFKVWIPDERKEYIGSVTALRLLMNSEIQSDLKKNPKKEEKGDGNKKQNTPEEDLKSLFGDFAYEPYKFENGCWKKTGIKYIPQMNEKVMIPNPNNPTVLMTIEGGWDSKVNAYYNLSIKIYDRIFAELCNVIFRKNYYDEVAGF